MVRCRVDDAVVGVQDPGLAEHLLPAFAGNLAGSGFAVGASVEFEDRVTADDQCRCGDGFSDLVCLRVREHLRQFNGGCVRQRRRNRLFVHVADHNVRLDAGRSQGGQSCRGAGSQDHFGDSHDGACRPSSGGERQMLATHRGPDRWCASSVPLGSTSSSVGFAARAALRADSRARTPRRRVLAWSDYRRARRMRLPR